MSSCPMSVLHPGYAVFVTSSAHCRSPMQLPIHFAQAKCPTEVFSLCRKGLFCVPRAPKTYRSSSTSSLWNSVDPYRHTPVATELEMLKEELEDILVLVNIQRLTKRIEIFQHKVAPYKLVTLLLLFFLAFQLMAVIEQSLSHL